MSLHSFASRGIGAFLLGIALTSNVQAAPVTLDFEDLSTPSYTEIAANYGGLAWDVGMPDHWGRHDGKWFARSDDSYGTAHSGNTYLFNGFGPQDLGFNLATPTDGVSAWFSLPAVDGNPSPIELIGYVGGQPTFYSAKLDLTSTPQLLTLFGSGITRVTVHASNAAWYLMDDLTIGAVPEPSVLLMLCIGAAAYVVGVRRRAHQPT